MNAHEIANVKRRTFDTVFGEKKGVELLDLQVWDDESYGHTMGEVSFLFGDLMTVQGIEDLCKDVADWMGGGLLGTVNLDFSGTRKSLSMMVEYPREAIRG